MSFNPRPPRGERRRRHLDSMPLSDVSIHAPREGSDIIVTGLPSLHVRVSIHAPREGSDTMQTWSFYDASVSIHAPREGSDWG